MPKFLPVMFGSCEHVSPILLLLLPQIINKIFKKSDCNFSQDSMVETAWKWPKLTQSATVFMNCITATTKCMKIQKAE